MSTFVIFKQMIIRKILRPKEGREFLGGGNDLALPARTNSLTASLALLVPARFLTDTCRARSEGGIVGSVDIEI